MNGEKRRNSIVDNKSQVVQHRCDFGGGGGDGDGDDQHRHRPPRTASIGTTTTTVDYGNKCRKKRGEKSILKTSIWTLFDCFDVAVKDEVLKSRNCPLETKTTERSILER